MKEKSLCFSGHRENNLPMDKLRLEIQIKEEVEKSIENGYSIFYHGACHGFDLICAEIVLRLKKKHKDIKLIAIVPFEKQAQSWSLKDKAEYEYLLSKSDEVVVLSKRYSHGCYHLRNRYMVDNSSKLICYCKEIKSGTGYTLNYARKNHVNCVNLWDGFGG